MYQRAKYFCDEWIEKATGQSPLLIVNTRGTVPTLATATCFGVAGAAAGAAITLVACKSTERAQL
jgi:solute carrier family 25 (mitochondrial carnitine/acylcarnitine transporter), member 20/29